MPCIPFDEKLYSGFPTRSDTNRVVQLQKICRGLKFRIQEVEELNFICPLLISSFESASRHVTN